MEESNKSKLLNFIEIKNNIQISVCYEKGKQEDIFIDRKTVNCAVANNCLYIIKNNDVVKIINVDGRYIYKNDYSSLYIYKNDTFIIKIKIL